MKATVQSVKKIQSGNSETLKIALTKAFWGAVEKMGKQEAASAILSKDIEETKKVA